MDAKNLPRLIDLSRVKANTTVEQMNQMVEMAKKYKFLCCFAKEMFGGDLAETADLYEKKMRDKGVQTRISQFGATEADFGYAD